MTAEPVVTELKDADGISALVERLRGWVTPVDACPCREAADTIQRLEADLSGSRMQVELAYRRLDDLQSERDRLREALDEIIPSKLTIAHAAKS
jgi:hypothetical protein